MYSDAPKIIYTLKMSVICIHFHWLGSQHISVYIMIILVLD